VTLAEARSGGDRRRPERERYRNEFGSEKALVEKEKEKEVLTGQRGVPGTERDARGRVR